MTAQLIMEAPFRLDRAGQTDQVVPNRPETLPGVCRVLFSTVTAAAANDSDVLTLSFDDGSTITIGRHPHGLSWQLVGQGVPLMRVVPSSPAC